MALSSSCLTPGYTCGARTVSVCLPLGQFSPGHVQEAFCQEQAKWIVNGDERNTEQRKNSLRTQMSISESHQLLQLSATRRGSRPWSSRSFCACCFCRISLLLFHMAASSMLDPATQQPPPISTKQQTLPRLHRWHQAGPGGLQVTGLQHLLPLDGSARSSTNLAIWYHIAKQCQGTDLFSSQLLCWHCFRF